MSFPLRLIVASSLMLAACSRAHESLPAYAERVVTSRGEHWSLERRVPLGDGAFLNFVHGESTLSLYLTPFPTQLAAAKSLERMNHFTEVGVGRVAGPGGSAFSVYSCNGYALRFRSIRHVVQVQTHLTPCATSLDAAGLARARSLVEEVARVIDVRIRTAA